jgi:hypothetical protein
MTVCEDLQDFELAVEQLEEADRLTLIDSTRSGGGLLYSWTI